MPVYCFYWEDEEFLMEIDADPEIVESLLDEYRKSDPDGYNDLEWLEFLEKKGIKARFISIDHYIYF